MSLSAGGGGSSSSGGKSPFELLTKVSEIIDDLGWEGLGKTIFGTIALTVTFTGVELFQALLGIPIAIFNMFATVIPALNQATLGGLASFIGASFGAGAASFGTGWMALLGIFQTPLGIAVALFTLWEVMYFMDYVDTDVLGVSMDIVDWIFSSDESGVAGEED